MGLRGWNRRGYRGKRANRGDAETLRRTLERLLPAFELADLTGKTWTLKALEGKTVLINVWASW